MNPDDRARKRQTRNLQDQIALLATPAAADAIGGRSSTPRHETLPGIVRMLPTPTTMDAHGSGGNKPEHVTLTDAVVREQLGAVPNPRHMLPTPVTDPSAGNGHARNLGGEISLLPTPAASRANDSETLEGWERRNDARDKAFAPPLAVVVKRNARDGVEWGDYEPAIRRAERVLGRPAPAPMIADGRKGQLRMNTQLPEFMMMLPDGHVTSPDLGLTRGEQLHVIGNGVVPAQAAHAIRELIGRIP